MKKIIQQDFSNCISVNEAIQKFRSGKTFIGLKEHSGKYLFTPDCNDHNGVVV